MKDKNSRSQVSNERQLDGGTDVDTTDLDGPSSLDRPGQGGTPDPTLLAGDPTGDDPFIPGSGEASKDFDAEDTETNRKQKARDATQSKKREDPTYEAGQGNLAEDHGGSTDPHSSLIESTIRSEDSHDTKEK